ncbi:MAG: ATP-binding protein [Deltaproteobacteria bacterium]|nr:ATP-binding protein [Deltaproteobacteria bacterium]
MVSITGQSPETSFRRVAMLGGAMVMMLGILGLAGWLAGAGKLARISWRYIPMAQSTAWSCLFLGSSLLLHRSRPLAGRGRGLALAVITLIAVFGFLNFLEYFVGVDLSFEEVWFPATEQFGRVVTNRMSPMTGAGMCISGIALFLVLRPCHLTRNLSGVLGLLVAMLGLVGTVGYLFGTPLLYGGKVIPMAANTTLAFLVMGVGLTAAAGPECWPLRALVGSSVRARLLRTFLPMTGFIILAQGWLHQIIPGLFSNPALTAALLALGFAGVMVLVVTAAGGAISKDLDRARAARQQAEAEIRALNLELEGRVRERTAQLVAANRELEAFSYSVSHDLRAPLRGIDGWTLAFMEDYAHRLDDQGRTYLERVRTETQHMGQLIDDLLSLSRVGRTEIQRQPVDLTALARAITGRLRETGPKRLVEFVIQEGLTAVGDPQLLYVALSNLLDNAWKFTGKRPGGLIEFGRMQLEGHPVFFVRDNGAGFDEAYADKLFGAFQRLHKASEFPGTGIGLATVQRIVHRHGGRVWAEAAADRGATFYFTL